MLAKPSHMRRCSHRWLDETISVPPNLCQSIATPPGPLAPHPIMSDFIASLELDIVQDPPLPNPVRTVPGFPPVGALAGLAPPAITRSFADWFPTRPSMNSFTESTPEPSTSYLSLGVVGVWVG